MYTPNFVIINTKKLTMKKLDAINKLNDIELKGKALTLGGILYGTLLYTLVVISEIKKN